LDAQELLSNAHGLKEPLSLSPAGNKVKWSNQK